MTEPFSYMMPKYHRVKSELIDRSLFEDDLAQRVLFESPIDIPQQEPILHSNFNNEANC